MIRNSENPFSFLDYIKFFFEVDGWSRLKNVDVIFVIYDINRSYSYNNISYSPFLNSLKESYEKNGLSCLSISGPLSRNKSDISFNASFFKSAIKRLFVNLIRDDEFNEIRFIQKVWIKLLKKTNPKRVITILASSELCYACHKLNIEIAELQHGVVNDMHPHYGEQFKKDVNPLLLPSNYLCYTDSSKITIDNWAFKHGIKVEIIKNPWLDRFINVKKDDLLVSQELKQGEWLKKLRARGRRVQKTPT
jgi:hypothetical protein